MSDADAPETPLSRALGAVAANDELLARSAAEEYIDTGEALEHMAALKACVRELMLMPGTRVRMNDACKKALATSSMHVMEFGDCIGTVEGPADFTGPSCQIKQLGPEVDVRWQPSNLRYMYNPRHLEIVK